MRLWSKWYPRWAYRLSLIGARSILFMWGPSKRHQNWVGIYASVLTRALGRNLNGLRAFGTYGMCNLRATSHTRPRAMTITLQALSLVEKVELVQVRFTLCLRDHGVCECKMHGCKAYMDSYMASDGSCFMVTWTGFKNHLLGVGLPQHSETMALWTLTTDGLDYFIMFDNPHE